MKRLDIDFGNGFLKYLRNGQPVTVPAYVADVIDPAKFKACNVLACVHSDSGLMQNGSMWIAGEDAQYQAPTKAIRVGSVPRSQGKARYALHQIAAIVEPVNEAYEIVCSVPDPDIQGKQLERALLGRHTFTANGREFTIAIDSVMIRPEGYGAAYEALSLGLVPRGGMTATLDVGHQTAIVTVFDARGTEIEDLRVVISDGGTQALYEALAQHTEIKKRFGGGITIAQIEQAVRSSHSSPTGVTLDGCSIDSIYRPAKASWFASIRNQAGSSIAPILPQLGGVVCLGGGVELLQGELPALPKIVLLGDPQTAGVRGLGKIQIARSIAA
jgi:Actin like proteins N terminal domain